jgi:3-hydroxybutyryl-CoA dehydrogenase
MEIRRIAIIGSGIMGAGIAQVAASKGFGVIMEDIKASQLNRAINTLEAYLLKDVRKEKLTENEYEKIKSRIKGTTDLKEAVADADVIIEAIIERMDAKKKLIKEVNRFSPDHAIFASNTSSISITGMACTFHRPDNFMGMHFFNPVPIMKPVELIRGLTTSEETYQAIHGLALRMGKTAIPVKDSPGFVWNRIFAPMMNEAVYTLMEDVALPEAIDSLAKLGNCSPIGPLALADFIGLDTLLMIMESLYDEFADSKYRPCPLLRMMVRAGYLGRKTGKGFYEYKQGKVQSG